MRMNMLVKFLVVWFSDCSDIAMAGGFRRPPHKDDLTCQALYKFGELQRTLYQV